MKRFYNVFLCASKERKRETMSDFDVTDRARVRYVPRAANISIQIDWRRLDQAVKNADAFFTNFVSAYPYFQLFLNWYATVSKNQRNLTYSQLNDALHKGGIVAIEQGLIKAFRIAESSVARTNPKAIPFNLAQEKAMLGCMTATTSSLHHLVSIAYDHGGRQSEGLKRLKNTLSDECLRLGVASLNARAKVQSDVSVLETTPIRATCSYSDTKDEDEEEDEEKEEEEDYSSARCATGFNAYAF